MLTHKRSTSFKQFVLQMAESDKNRPPWLQSVSSRVKKSFYFYSKNFLEKSLKFLSENESNCKVDLLELDGVYNDN